VVLTLIQGYDVKRVSAKRSQQLAIQSPPINFGKNAYKIKSNSLFDDKKVFYA